MLTLVPRLAYISTASGTYHHSLTEDIAQNLYHNRDYRRKYPQTDVITQQYLTELLLASPNEDGTKRYVVHVHALTQ